MANCCGFDMKVVGTKEALEKFDNMIDDAVWGVYSMDKYDTEESATYYYGDCKWSIGSLKDCTVGSSLYDMCERCNVSVEVYGEEYGQNINEHCIIDNNGVCIIDEGTDAYMWCLDEFENEEEAIDEFKKMLGDNFDESKIQIEDDYIYYDRLMVDWNI